MLNLAEKIIHCVVVLWKGDVLPFKDSLNVTPDPLFKGFSRPFFVVLLFLFGVFCHCSIC